MVIASLGRIVKTQVADFVFPSPSVAVAETVKFPAPLIVPLNEPLLDNVRLGGRPETCPHT